MNEILFQPTQLNASNVFGFSLFILYSGMDLFFILDWMTFHIEISTTMIPNSLNPSMAL